MRGGTLDTLRIMGSGIGGVVETGEIYIDGDSTIRGNFQNDTDVPMIINPNAVTGGRLVGSAGVGVIVSELTESAAAPNGTSAAENSEITTISYVPSDPDEPIVRGNEFDISKQPVNDKNIGELIVIISDDKPIFVDNQQYYGTVDIKSYYTDTPRAIPKEVFIRGSRYLVGDTIYIVANNDFAINGYAETGVSYVFEAVANTEDTAVFTAEGLPEGVVLSEDGILSAENLPIKGGVYNFTVTVDNGKDTYSTAVSLEIKDGCELCSEFGAENHGICVILKKFLKQEDRRN
jgi:hypothetical protein